MADRGGLTYEEMKDAEGLFIPANARFMVDSMSNYSTNKFRIELVSSSEAQAGSIISVNMPSSSLLDLDSIALHMDVECSGPADPNAPLANEVYAKLPQNGGQSLIERCEISLNGVSISQALNQYNTAYNLKQLVDGNVPRNSSVDRAIAHAEIDPDDPTPSAGTAGIEAESLVVQDWIGFLGAREHSTRFFPSDLFGNLTLRLTMSQNSVLVPKVFGVPMGTALANQAQVDNASAMSYKVKNLYFTVQSCSMNQVFNRMLRERLQVDSYIPLNFKDYYNYTSGGITTDSQTTRYQLSSGSVDKIYQTQRDSNSKTTGIVPKQLPNSAMGTGAFCANAFRFRSYNSWGLNVNQKLRGNFRHRSSFNNIQMPQFQQDILGCLADVSYVADKCGMGAEGTMISSRESYNDSRFVALTTLCHPQGKYGCSVKSGANSRGILSAFTYETSGQLIPGPSPRVGGTGETGAIDTFVLVEVTSELRCGLGKDITVIV